MAKIDKTIIIHAPVEKIFKFMADPYNLVEIWPAMDEIRNVTPNPNGGADFEWTYKMAGVKFDGASETTEFIPNKRSITRSKRGIESMFCWEYEDVAEGTRLHLEVGNAPDRHARTLPQQSQRRAANPHRSVEHPQSAWG